MAEEVLNRLEGELNEKEINETAEIRVYKYLEKLLINHKQRRAKIRAEEGEIYFYIDNDGKFTVETIPINLGIGAFFEKLLQRIDGGEFD